MIRAIVVERTMLRRFLNGAEGPAEDGVMTKPKVRRWGDT